MAPRFPEDAHHLSLLLASASPRRKEILEAAGIPFLVVPAAVPEVQQEGESPEQFVLRAAAEKAEAALDQIARPCSVPILGADTVVVVERQTLGKPVSADDARRMLQLLSGREHQVLTGLCLLDPPRQWPPVKHELGRDLRVAATKVKFCNLTAEEIEEYVATGEPFDKAGGYGIQGQASRYVEWIQGCYFNVVGLPASLVYQMLKRFYSSPRPAWQE